MHLHGKYCIPPLKVLNKLFVASKLIACGVVCNPWCFVWHAFALLLILFPLDAADSESDEATPEPSESSDSEVQKWRPQVQLDPDCCKILPKIVLVKLQ